ncbi:hypothetical protein TL16_g11856 [Triparma laevis f. inornata]|uniref:O-GlcNAc transferase C-terminal domain-containing protein n=1 Tax=Triparma laevis f. inornata TaxID=1714386 RepID=A0A9W7ES26_9STRA|nr:hypothetical protein TL16_g11856 [Triparma laevis f. inornata]
MSHRALLALALLILSVHVASSLDPIIALNVTSPPSFKGIWACKVKSKKGKPNKIQVCTHESKQKTASPLTSMESGKKVTRLQVFDSQNTLRYTSDPIPKADTTPPPSSAFDFEVLEWESGELLCNDFSLLQTSSMSTPARTQKPHQLSFIIEQNAPLIPPPCLSLSLNLSNNFAGLASLSFQDLDFNKAKSLLLQTTSLSPSPALTTAATITSAILGEHVREINVYDYDFAGAREILLGMSPINSSYSSSGAGLLQTTINRLKHFERWNDLHMSLALELGIIGLEGLVLAHTEKVGRCDEFVTKKWLLEQERYFCLRQCLLIGMPTTLGGLEEAEKRRSELMTRMDLWITQNRNGKMRTSEPHIDIGIRHAFLVVYQGLGLASDAAFYDKMNELHRSFTFEGLLDYSIIPTAASHGSNEKETEEKTVRRIGLVSNNLRFHSVGRLVRGVFSELSRETIHFTIISDERSLDDAELQARADQVLFLQADIGNCQKEIAALGLDTLIFADLGMDAKTTYLAYSRLAKTQVSFWGHPVSFNLASMDYSISGENFGSFQEFYGEQLITFGGITTKFGMDVRVGGSSGGESESERVETLKRLGLVGVTEETRIYLCFQSIMKLHPSFDSAIREISNLDPSGIIVLMSDTKKPGWQKKIRQRLADVPNVQFLDAMKYDSYMSLIECSHVTLDPYPFGGGVTIFESLSSGIPVVSDASKLKVFNFATAWNAAIGEDENIKDENINIRGLSYAEQAFGLAQVVAADRGRILAGIKFKTKNFLINRNSEVEEWETFLTNI